MTLDAWKDKRKAWTKARDAEKVSAGAVSGVSLGDAIEKVTKSGPKGLKALRAAVAKVLEASKKYKAGIKKHPKLISWIDEHVDKAAKSLDEDCKDTINVLVATPKAISVGLQKSLLTCQTFSHLAGNLKDAAESQKKPWIDLAKPELEKYSNGAKVLSAVASNLKNATKFVKVEIPGKTSAREDYEFFAEIFEGLSKAMAFLGSAKDLDAFSDATSVVRRNAVWASHSGAQGQAQLVENAQKIATEYGAA